MSRLSFGVLAIALVIAAPAAAAEQIAPDVYRVNEARFDVPASARIVIIATGEPVVLQMPEAGDRSILVSADVVDVKPSARILAAARQKIGGQSEVTITGRNESVMFHPIKGLGYSR